MFPDSGNWFPTTKFLLHRAVGSMGVAALPQIPYILAWLPATAGILYLKLVSVPHGTFIDFRMRSLPLLQELSVYRVDIFLCFLLIPLSLFILTLVSPRPFRGPLIVLVSIASQLLSFVNVQSFKQVGRLSSLRLLSDSVHWAWNHPDVIQEYVRPSGVVKLLVLIVLTLLIGLWANKQSAAMSRAQTCRLWTSATRAATVPLLALISLPWLSRLPPSPATQSILISSLDAFWGLDDEEQTANMSCPAPAELNANYRKLAQIGVSSVDVRYWRRAEGSDIIIFVLETSPAKILPIDSTLDDLPNLRELRNRAFVAPKHYTTYPLTVRALFSSLSGWYPSDFMKDFDSLFSDLEVPGIARQLSRLGYKTAWYSPSAWRFEYDVAIPKALGFKQLSFGAMSLESDKVPWIAKRHSDLESLRALESDLETWLTKDQRYMVVFAPQLSHSPWLDVTASHVLKNVMDRGRPLMAAQDAYLGEIIKLLAAHRRLDKTLIVVVGDHGLRTRDEDPDLPVGTLDDISFHVPMLIYAPQVLTASVTIPWLTSHIDISPTLLDLIGIDRPREWEQGSPIWDPALRTRRTFLFARHLYSADGYHAIDRFVMQNNFYNLVYGNDHLSFGPESRIASTSPEYRTAVESIRQMVILQRCWVEQFGRGDHSVRTSMQK